MSAKVMGTRVQRLEDPPLLRGEGRRREVLVLAAFAGLWGLVYGGIMNVWFWPFAVGPADQYWEAGIGVLETLKRYAAFYLTTSLAWDALRAVGNVLLMLAFAAPTLRALRRFQRRFAYSHRPVFVRPTLLDHPVVTERPDARDGRRQHTAAQNAVSRSR